MHSATAALARAIGKAFTETYLNCQDVPDPQQSSRNLVKLLDLERRHLDLSGIATDKAMLHLVEHLTAQCWLALGLVAQKSGSMIRTVSLPAGGLRPTALSEFAQLPGVAEIRLSGHHDADLSALTEPYKENDWVLPLLTLHDIQPFITVMVPFGMKVRSIDTNTPVVNVRTIDADGWQNECTLSCLMEDDPEPRS